METGNLLKSLRPVAHSKALQELPLYEYEPKTRPVSFAQYANASPSFLLPSPQERYDLELDMTAALLKTIKFPKGLERKTTSNEPLPVLPMYNRFINEVSVAETIARSGGMLEVLFFRLQETIIMGYMDNETFKEHLTEIQKNRQLIESSAAEHLNKKTTNFNPPKDLHLSSESTNLSFNSTNEPHKNLPLQISTTNKITFIPHISQEPPTDQKYLIYHSNKNDNNNENIAPISQEFPSHKNQKYPKYCYKNNNNFNNKNIPLNSQKFPSHYNQKYPKIYYKNNNYSNGGKNSKRSHYKLNNKLHQSLYNQYKMVDKNSNPQKYLPNMRREYNNFKTWMKSEETLLKCEAHHMENSFLTKLRPRNKRIFCPYSNCQLCSKIILKFLEAKLLNRDKEHHPEEKALRRTCNKRKIKWKVTIKKKRSIRF